MKEGPSERWQVGMPDPRDITETLEKGGHTIGRHPQCSNYSQRIGVDMTATNYIFQGLVNSDFMLSNGHCFFFEYPWKFEGRVTVWDMSTNGTFIH